jgi:UDP-N-acetylglucosamine acyltransferase
VIDSRAEIDTTAEIGPGAVIGPNVRIGAETVVGPYAVIESNSTIGRRNRISQFASLGTPPQDLKYRGEESTLEIGDDNQIFEFTTLHRGTEGGGMTTRIGNHVMLMNYVHIAHDCQIGDHVVIVNNCGIAGHCVIEEWAIVEGMCGVHQFTHIGAHAIVAAGSKLALDVPPFTMVAGAERARLVGINEIGLARREFAPDTIAALKSAVRTIFYSKLRREEALAQVLAEHGTRPEIRRLVSFINESKRGVVGRERD